MAISSLRVRSLLIAGCSLIAFTTAFSGGAASAQPYEDRSSLVSRFDKIERDIGLLQRQIARGERTPVRGGTSRDAGASSGSAAHLEVRLSALEEQLRSIQGSIEQATFQNRQLQERLDKFQADVEFRLSNSSGSPLGGAPTSPLGAAPAVAAPQPAPVTSIPAPANTDRPGVSAQYAPAAPVDSTTATQSAYNAGTVATLGRRPEPVADASGKTSFDNPRDQYNYAFKLLNQAKYAEAGQQFEQFIANYPSDPLAGNAYYWLGETHYVRRDYVKASDQFRQGFEAKPNGPKAADNLLKLSMSLNALGRSKDACVVLDQVIKKFSSSSTSVRDKANQERNRIGCS